MLGDNRRVPLAPDPADLRAVFGGAVSSYEIEPIDPHLRIHSVTGGVYRVRADGQSCIIKVVQHGVDETPDGLWQSGATEAHRNYWKREWLAFDSGLLNALPGKLRAPRALLTTEYDDSCCWIWMEDVLGRTGSALSLNDLDAIAFALGTTHGAYASGVVEVPADPWLSRNWLRGWVDACSSFIEPLSADDRWTDPRLEPLRPLRERIASLWAQRESLLEIADEPPLAIAHWDLWPANLYVTNDGEAVAIDWSQVGVSGITHDLDQITLDTVWMQVRPDESLEELEERILRSYVAGLRDGGYAARPQDIRRWYAAAAALRYAWLGGGQPDVLADENAVHFQQQRWGRDIGAIVATKARVVERAVHLGESALGR